MRLRRGALGYVYFRRKLNVKENRDTVPEREREKYVDIYNPYIYIHTYIYTHI